MHYSRLSVAAVFLTALCLPLVGCGGGSSGGGGGPDTFFAGAITDGTAGGTALDNMAVVTLTPQGGGAPIDVPVAADGTFSLAVAAGIYDVLVTHPEYENSFTAAVDVVAAVVTTFDVAMDQLTLVKGTVGITGGGSLDEYTMLTLTPAVGPAIEVTAAADGSYNTGAVDPGTYDLLISRPGYTPIMDAAFVVNPFHNIQNPMLPALPAGEYIAEGSEGCGRCHNDAGNEIYDNFKVTGHPFKINKVVNVEAPTYPFSTLGNALSMITDNDAAAGDPKAGTDNSAGTPLTWGEVTYVIGGWGWKARFMDISGFIVTGSNVQYNLANQSITAYHDNETDKPFNCGNCHTTGWKPFDDASGTNNNPTHQDGLPGISGTWAHTGIQCEACHGSGGNHSRSELAADITLVATPRTTAQMLATGFDFAAYGKAIACGECHTRDGEKDYPTFVSAYTNAGGPEDMGGRIAASGGLIRHHEQYDELLGVDPDFVTAGSTRSTAFKNAHLDCSTCHSPHNTTVYQDNALNTSPDGVNKTNADCMVCHPTKDPNDASTFGMKGLSCLNCHMPQLAKSALSTPPTGNGPTTGDVTSHIFSIDMTKSPATQQFTASGSYAYPWLTAMYACWTCHNSTGIAHDRTGINDSGYSFH